MDDAILKERLRRQESVLMLPSASRCGKAAALLVQALEADGADDDLVAERREALAREVSHYELEVRKNLPAMQACEAELKDYAELQREVDGEVDAAKREIERLREELRGARRVRRRREEYEALAAEVNRHPSKRKCVDEITELENKKRAIASLMEGYEAQVTTRRRQFHLLLQTLADLRSTIGAEEEDMEDRDGDARAAEDGGGMAVDAAAAEK